MPRAPAAADAAPLANRAGRLELGGGVFVNRLGFDTLRLPGVWEEPTRRLSKQRCGIRLDSIAGGSAIQLSTETRVACTDPTSARRVARYWRLIRPASGAIRRSWLTAIKRRAERHADGEADPEVWER